MFRRVTSSVNWSLGSFGGAASRCYSRKMVVPIHIQDPTNSKTPLQPASLLFKWTSFDKKLLQLVPVIIGNESTPPAAANLDDPAVVDKATAPLSEKALQTFHKLMASSYDLARLIATMENKLPMCVLKRRHISIEMSREADGSVNISGELTPYQAEHAPNESEKKLYAAVLEPPAAKLLKQHLESVLVEIFGIENHWYLLRRSVGHSHQLQRLEQRHPIRRQPAHRDLSPVSQSETPKRNKLEGVYASELEKEEHAASKPTSTPLLKDTQSIDTLSHADVSEQEESAASVDVEVGAQEDREPTSASVDAETEKATVKSKRKSKSASAPASPAKKKKSVAKKSKKADDDAQNLFDV